MRRVLMVAVLVGLAGCVAGGEPPIAADWGWHSRSGALLSSGEIAALRQSCRPQMVPVAIDSARLPAGPLHDLPVYHPGGEGLANGPLTGIAAADRPIAAADRRAALPAAEPVAECLYRKGLVRSSR